MKTNGDRIREMSDEDLAVLLAELGTCECCTCKGTDHDCMVKSCDEGILEWLQQEGGIRNGRLQAWWIPNHLKDKLQGKDGNGNAGTI